MVKVTNRSGFAKKSHLWRKRTNKEQTNELLHLWRGIWKNESTWKARKQLIDRRKKRRKKMVEENNMLEEIIGLKEVTSM
jgi:hypothetical protein